jgi:hypothetical protein
MKLLCMMSIWRGIYFIYPSRSDKVEGNSDLTGTQHGLRVLKSGPPSQQIFKGRNLMKILLSAVLLIAGAGLAKADTIETITFNLGVLHPGSTLSATFDVPTSIGTGLTLDVTYAFSDSLDYAEGSLTGPTGGTLAGTVSIDPNSPISNYVVNFSAPEFFNPSGNMFDRENILSEDGLARCASFPCTATGQFEDSQAFSNGLYTIAPAATTPEPSSFLLLATGLAGAGRLLYSSRRRFA